MNEHIKLLLIEDNPGDVRLIREMLADGKLQFELETADSFSEGLEFLTEKMVDVILLDLELPDSSGFDTYLQMRAHAHRTPIIILTGRDDEELALKSVRHDAQDYLVKGEINSSTLSQSIRYSIERMRAREEIGQKTDDLMLINALNDASNHGKNLIEIFNVLARETERIFSSNGSTVYLLSEDKKFLVMQKSIFRDKLVKLVEPIIGMRFSDLDIKVPLNSDSIYRQILEEGKPVLIDDPVIIR